MIKFFRKIRYDLMENQTSAKASAGKKTGAPAEARAKAGKYLKYAIGEIILVVIALQINNWNDNRKTEVTKHTLLLELKQAFQENLELIEGHQKEGSMRFSVGQLFHASWVTLAAALIDRHGQIQIA